MGLGGNPDNENGPAVGQEPQGLELPQFGRGQRLVRRGITPLVIIRPRLYRELSFD